jgi:hypothetical protein
LGPAREIARRCLRNECGKQFTATVGTLFERSKIPLTRVVACYASLAEKHFLASASSHARRLIQEYVVYNTSYS